VGVPEVLLLSRVVSLIRCFVGGFISALINDVLDLSKIEAGKMELESVAFNLRKEVDSVFTLFDEKLQQKKLEVFMLVHEAVPTCVVGDPGRFRQVLGFIVQFSNYFSSLWQSPVQKEILLFKKTNLTWNVFLLQILVNLVSNALKVSIGHTSSV